MVRVAVAGATGYAGAELVRLLSSHPGVRLTILTSRQFAGKRFTEAFPAFAGRLELLCEEIDEARLAAEADVVFTALPHKMPMKIAPALVRAGVRLIDLSADFRFRDAALYERTYQPHAAPELLSRSVYGLAEVYAREIAAAAVVGNPGCYPTSVLLPLIPLLREGLIAAEGIIADSKSGVSGAGRSPSLRVHFCEVAESFKAYSVAGHRHAPEMEMVLAREAGRPVGLTFVPHLVPMSRGMLSTIYARPAPGVNASRLRDCLEGFYRGRPFVRIRPPGVVPDTLHVRGTNFCDIGFVLDEPNRRLVLLSAIDNLGKGAAGQAVQNLNLMCGFEETAGLDAVPAPL